MTTTTRKPQQQLPASELRALRNRVEGWVRQLNAVLEDIETVREHHGRDGVMPSRWGGRVTVGSLLPNADLLDVLTNGGGEVWFDTDREMDRLTKSETLADALGVLSAAFLQRKEGE